MHLLAFIFVTRNEPIALAIFGASAGIYLFYHGFRLLQRKRLILGTPSSKIRSAAMGLVEVSGQATGPYTLTAPVSGKPCYYYRTTAWQYKQSGRNKEWVKVAEESLHVPFYLDDNTGRLLINPQGAELDIHRDYHEEFSDSFFSTAPSVPVNVSNFLGRHGVGLDQKIKVEECCIKPKNALFVLGTLAENHGPEVGPAPVTTDNSHQLKFSVNLPGAMATPLFGANRLNMHTTVSIKTVTRDSSGAVHHEVIRLDDGKPSSAGDMSSQGKVAAALMKAGITNPAAWAAAGITNPTAALAQTPSVPVSTGNGAAAAPAPATDGFDLHPATVLMKGEHNPTFLISWRSEKEVVQSLGWKSALMIWGGPLLTSVSVYVIASYFGWV